MCHANIISRGLTGPARTVTVVLREVEARTVLAWADLRATFILKNDAKGWGPTLGQHEGMPGRAQTSYQSGPAAEKFHCSWASNDPHQAEGNLVLSVKEVKKSEIPN